jgi:hypothetical protein
MERSISRGLGSAGASRAFSAADSWASLVCACLGMISVPRPCDTYHGEPEVKSGSLPSIPISNGEPDIAHLRQVPPCLADDWTNQRGPLRSARAAAWDQPWCIAAWRHRCREQEHCSDDAVRMKSDKRDEHGSVSCGHECCSPDGAHYPTMEMGEVG